MPKPPKPSRTTMINRFKTALINAVSNTGLDASVVGLSGGGHSESSSSTGSRKNSRQISHENGTSDGVKTKKYEYGRPHFLQLVTADEITVTADHVVRPIIVPRDLSFLPWEAGYAE